MKFEQISRKIVSAFMPIPSASSNKILTTFNIFECGQIFLTMLKYAKL